MKLITALVVGFLAFAIVSSNASAATDPYLSAIQDESGRGVTFRMPDKYMQVDFPNYKGMLLLDPERPAGMFIVYVPDGETAVGTTGKIREKVASMFSSDPKQLAAWTITTVPAHKSKPNETAELSIATGEASDVQVLTVTLPNGRNPVVYGYFAMRHNKKPQGDDGRFLRMDGTGVVEFDEFRSTIKPSVAGSMESA